MKPMLAKRFAEHIHKHPYPLYVQPKLNGVRGIYWNGLMQSRDQHIWEHQVVKHIVDQLESLPPDVILDGEFYVHGWPLQKINGAISVNRLEPTATTAHVQYHVFDCVLAQKQQACFAERHEHLRSLFVKHITGPHVCLVDTHLCANEIEAEHWYAHYKSLVYEGMMYRADAPYGLEQHCTNKENRWDILLKRKDWLDEDCVIIDVELGTGKFANVVGSLVLQFPNGQQFKAGSGLSDMQRHFYMDSPPIGRIAKIKYEMLSSSGIPLKPTIELIEE